MSRTEHLVGKLKPVKHGHDVEAVCKEILDNANVDKEEYYDSYQEKLADWSDGGYLVINGLVYQVEVNKQDPDTDIAKAKNNEDGTVDFEVRYYNGGCSFQEAVESALKTIY